MENGHALQTGRAIHPCVIELREMLRQVLGDNFVRLYHYGSRVAGVAASDSDYDVLCVVRRPLTSVEKDEVQDRRIDLQLVHDVFFDLHFFLEDEIQSPSLGSLLFLEHAVGDGVVV